MLHHKGPVSVLNGLCHQAAFDVAPVDIVILKIAVAPGDHRLSRKSLDLQNIFLQLHRKEVGGDFPPEHGVNDVL